MPVRDRFRILAPSIIVGFCLLAMPAKADSCAESACKPTVEAKPTVETTTPQQPMRLEKFRRRPVALGTSARVIKTPSGRYARVKHARRAKPQPDQQPQPPQFMPVVVSPEAAAALAMQATLSAAAAQVRVVEAGEFNDIDQAAAPLVPIAVPTTVEPAVRVASADETMPAVPIAQAATATADQTATGFDLRGWFSRLGSWLGETFATLLAAIRGLFG